MSNEDTGGCVAIILLIMFIVLCVKQCTIQDYTAETNERAERLDIRTKDMQIKQDSILLLQKQLLEKPCN